VDPFIGTGGHGHTYPGATVPFGMVQLSPDTRLSGWDGCSAYHYSDTVIYGFSHTHLSGTGCSDYGDLLFMPIQGNPSPDKKVYSSPFSHKTEKASPGYYAVKLKKSNIEVELTATTRVGFHKYTVNSDGKVSIILDLTHRDKVLDSYVKVVSKTRIEGYRISEAWAKDQHIYFVAEFSKPMDEYGIYQKDALTKKISEAKGVNVKAYFSFKSVTGDIIYLKVGISAVSIDGARKNLEKELNHWDFEKVKNDAKDLWNKELGKIEAKTSGLSLLKTFYTALYHTMIVPNVNMDVDSMYRGRDSNIHKAVGFTNYQVFSLWDTFRALHPLYTIIDQKRTLDFINTFLVQYEQGGRLPVWELASNETDCMIGYHSVSVITDAAVKGIRNFDMNKALEAMKKSAVWNHYGLPSYMEHGYISTEDNNESVSKTLEYAYDDWCIATFARMLQKNEDYTTYIERAQNYKNLFDTETGFMRPKTNGNWLSPFIPREVNNNYTEANAWQYTFFVPQDISGLIGLMGGKEKFDRKLDELFTTSDNMTGREQVDITGLIGQYAHGNEPSHHMAYLYSFAGYPWKTQSMVHRICNEFYKPSPDGLIGNEDCGQMSAWFILSAIGFYPVTPGLPYYTIGSPMFEEVKIHTENGNTFTIRAKDISVSNFYISKAALNGEIYNKSYISHDDIMKGGTIEFEMNPVSNKSWGIKENDIPLSSISDNHIAVVPVITPKGLPFNTSLEIRIMSSQTDDKIFYEVGEKGVNTVPTLFKTPFVIDSSKTIYAYTVNNAGQYSKTVKAVFTKNLHPNWKVNLKSKYNSQYTAGGDDAIINAHTAGTDWKRGGWQGYQGQDFEAVIDMNETRNVKQISADFLQDVNAWIMMPKTVTFSFSLEGSVFTNPVEIKNTVADNDLNIQTKEFSQNIAPVKARFVKIKAVNYGKMPSWHESKGENGWIFIDRVNIELKQKIRKP